MGKCREQRVKRERELVNLDETTEKGEIGMKTLKLALLAAVCVTMLTGCASMRRGGRQDNRIDNRGERTDLRNER